MKNLMDLFDASPKKKAPAKKPKKDDGTRSDRERFDAYHRRSKSGKLFFVVLIALREYGMFIIPLFPAYLLFYYIVFKNGGAQDGTQWLYIVMLVCLLSVLAAGWFLRKLYRNHRYHKFSKTEVPLFKGNIWRCPFCGQENRLLSPCRECGIFPELYKSDMAAPKLSKAKKRSRRERREFDSYVPQFEENK